MNDHAQFTENLFLTNATAKHLYESYAKQMPIIDYHCHLQAKEIFENKEFTDIGEMWLAHDHYKWRAMRTFGIEETLITGEASYHEKFLSFAKILPFLIGNPLYIWCALELKRFFDIDEPLHEDNAQRIYNQTKACIQEKHITPRWCMEKSQVEVVCTTEDPTDELPYHLQLAKDPSLSIRVLTAFRPDNAMFCERASFSAYVDKLATVSNTPISDFKHLLLALEKRLEFFRTTGTTVSDDGIPDFSFVKASDQEIEDIFTKAYGNKSISKHEADQFRTAFLLAMGRLYHRHGFVMQLHVGTYLDANTVKVQQIGQSTGFDCTDDSTKVRSIGELLNTLTTEKKLPKTILYPLDGSKVETFAVLAAGFCDSGTKAKVQLGAPWWFNDQAYGLERQFEAAANLYPLSLSVGMLTDSRSFLSYPRHELYRRVLCNFLGKIIERGEYFGEEKTLQKIIENICYYNVKEYFGF